MPIPEFDVYVDAAPISITISGAQGPSTGGGNTNLTFSRDATTVTVLSDTGTDAVLPVATGSLAGVMSAADKTTIGSLSATYQPLDSDLSSIAALTTTSYGRSVLTLANGAAAVTLFGLGTLATQNGTIGDYLTTAAAASGYQPLNSDLTVLTEAATWTSLLLTLDRSFSTDSAIYGDSIVATTSFSGPGTGITGLPLSTGVTGTLADGNIASASTWNAKQAALVSGTNIKTINGSSVLGSGDLSVTAGAGGSTTQIQLNNSGALSGVAGLTAHVVDGSVTHTQNSLATSTRSGFSLYNNTAAGAGAQQVSPSIFWRGNGWKTDATAASQTVDFQAYVRPIQGTANPSGLWVLQSNINGGGLTDCASITSSGVIIAEAQVRLKGYTVATLPAGTVGDTAYVTDALTPTFLTSVVGGGAVTTTVFYNGTQWVVQ